jgi:hypothetical protein
VLAQAPHAPVPAAAFGSDESRYGDDHRYGDGDDDRYGERYADVHGNGRWLHGATADDAADHGDFGHGGGLGGGTRGGSVSEAEAEADWHRSFRALLPNVNVSFRPAVHDGGSALAAGAELADERREGSRLLAGLAHGGDGDDAAGGRWWS